MINSPAFTFARTTSVPADIYATAPWHSRALNNDAIFSSPIRSFVHRFDRVLQKRSDRLDASTGFQLLAARKREGSRGSRFPWRVSRGYSAATSRDQAITKSGTSMLDRRFCSKGISCWSGRELELSELFFFSSRSVDATGARITWTNAARRFRDRRFALRLGESITARLRDRSGTSPGVNYACLRVKSGKLWGRGWGSGVEMMLGVKMLGDLDFVYWVAAGSRIFREICYIYVEGMLPLVDRHLKPVF